MKSNEIKEVYCLVGTMLPEAEFNKINFKSRKKSAASPIIMQNHIYQSLVKNGISPSVYAYPPIACFPGSKVFMTLPRKVYVESNMPIRIVPVINILFLKQITVFFSFLLSLLFWSLKNMGKNRNILVYADFIEYTIPTILVGHLFHCNTVLFLTELPGYEHYYKERKDIKSKLIIFSERIKQRIYRLFDGYIFVSEPLQKYVNRKNKPCTVIEGFADNACFEIFPKVYKEERFTIMYAGSIGSAYNIETLLDGFHTLSGDYQLWIYGSGTNEEYVKKLAQEDKRIIYHGRVPHEEVLYAEKRAHVLLHTKTDADEYSRFAFSSKIIEYMSSGTPVLTTIVGGIPKEYYRYTYVISNATAEGIATSLKELANKKAEELEQMGEKAVEFVMNKKSYSIQGTKIIKLFREIQNMKGQLH